MKIGRIPPKVFFLLMAAVFVFVSLLSMSWGQIDIPFKNIVAVFCQYAGVPFYADVVVTPEQEAVLFHIRLPRTLVGLMVGAGLGASGTVMQGIIRWPIRESSGYPAARRWARWRRLRSGSVK